MGESKSEGRQRDSARTGSSSGTTPLAIEALEQNDLLRGCSEPELAGVFARSTEIALAPGELLFGEDDVADAVWILSSGELMITKLANGDEVVIDHLSPGAFLGEISLLTHSAAEHRARAKSAVRLLRIPGDVFYELLRSCRAVSETVLRTMAERVRRIEHMLQQRERMAGLGTLAAGLAHELNNPAAAAKRAAVLLKEHFGELEPIARRLASRQWSPEEVQLLQQLEAATGAVDPGARELDALTRSDREDAVGCWLDNQEVARAWELAPVLVDRGVDVEMLERVMHGCNPSAVADALAWMERMSTIRQMLDEVEGSTTRIAQMVSAVKAYSYVDTTSLRTADVHEALENSLTILGHKLRDARVTVERVYDHALPAIQMYGTELGQVWTNILDNAADALAQSPSQGDAARDRRITIRTAGDASGVRVEITDSGPGIPPETLSRIFEPFFTTKEAGKGTGLGLEIAKRIVLRHRGTIEVTSEPAATRFIVSLPTVQPGRDGAEGRVDGVTGEHPTAKGPIR